MKNIKPKQMSESQIQAELETAMSCSTRYAEDQIIINLIAHIKYLDGVIEGLMNDIRYIDERISRVQDSAVSFLAGT